MIARRRFLEISLVGAAAAMVHGLARGQERPPAGLSPRGLHAARTLGRRYLREHPEERRFDDVEALLAAGGGGEEPLAGIRRAIREDFDRERVVRVDGWVLARTEARLCAHLARAHGHA